MRSWDELSQSLGEASAPAEVTGALDLGARDRLPAGRASSSRSRRRTSRGSRSRPSVPATTGCRSGATTRWCSSSRCCPTTAGGVVAARDRASVRELTPELDDELAGRVCSLYALPLVSRSRPAGRVGDAPAAGGARRSTGPTRRSSWPRPTTPGSALTRARRFEQEHDVAIALQRSLLPETLPDDRRASTSPAATAPAASGSRSAATGTTPCAGRTGSSISRWRRRRARYRGRGADGPAPQRVPRACLRAHLAGRDRPPHAAPRARRGHGDRGLPQLRSLHGRARLHLGRPSADAAPRRGVRRR